MRKSIIGFFATSLLGFGLCLFPSAAAAEKVRIGALFPFSGPLALLGHETLEGPFNWSGLSAI